MEGLANRALVAHSPCCRNGKSMELSEGKLPFTRVPGSRRNPR